MSPYFYKMFRFMRPYAVRYGITQFIYASQGFAFPFILSVFAANIMEAIVAGERDAIFSAAVTLAIMMGVYLAVFLVAIYVNIIVIERAGMDMKQQLFRTFVRTGLEDITHSGEGIAAINTDANTALAIFETPLMQLINSLITIVGASIVVFAVDLRLGAAVFAVGVVSFFMQHRFTKPLARIGKTQLEANADAVKSVSNIFAGAITLRAYHMQSQVYLSFDKENARLKKLEFRRGLIRMGQRLFGTVEGWLTLAVVFGFGGYLVTAGYIPFPVLASAYIMAASLTSSIGSLGENFANLQPPIAGAERVFAILERELPQKNGASQTAKDYALRLENLTFQYRDAQSPVVENFSLHIAENEMVAFTGASGSGKSTLLKAITGLYARDDLNMHIGDLSFAQSTLENWRLHFAYVDQSGKLFDMTIRENIALGAGGNATDEEIIAAAKAAAIHDFIETLEQGYDTPCGEKGASFSGGQRQRIAIARALIKKAPVLVFDEATSALDAETEQEILQTVETLRKEYTILMATHNLESAKMADRVVSLTRP
ncbi:MAG: ABC transporter ATP-binding protein/permease [Defluviitaleaceae bacterium]|nr:ABC transporter ATP-binding protein/permease [Defluviitaleaceae bacterium]MCL2273939.1 ABC transporter ATP-binding protein/permease [Defluviitaleaceae bacterium]